MSTPAQTVVLQERNTLVFLVKFNRGMKLDLSQKWLYSMTYARSLCDILIGHDNFLSVFNLLNIKVCFNKFESLTFLVGTKNGQKISPYDKHSKISIVDISVKLVGVQFIAIDISFDISI